MKIGIDGRVLGRRGVGRYLKNLLAALADLGSRDEFTVFLGPRSRTQDLPRNPRFRGLSLGPGHPAWHEQARIPALARKLGLDLLHFPDNTGPLRCRVPFVLTLHDTMWMRPLREAVARPTPSQRLQDLYRKWVCPRAAARAGRVLTITRFSRRDILEKLPLDPSRVEVVSEGLDPAFSKGLPGARARALTRGLGLEGPYVLASGASDRRKNVDRLIEAFALAGRKSPLLKRARLAVTSMGDRELATTTYRQTAARAGVSGRVRFLGYVGEEELKALYQEALCFAYPSLWEGFGLPVLEAFGMGCPVLASNATAIPETAGKGALLVDPEDVVGMARGFHQMLRPALRDRLVLAGRKELGRYSWERAARQTLGHYRSALH